MNYPLKFNAIKISFQSNKEASENADTLVEFINTWGLDNMATILETIFSNTFFEMKIAVFCSGDSLLGPISEK